MFVSFRKCSRPPKPDPISDHNCQNLYPFSDQNGSKTIPFGAAHTYIHYIGEYPPPPGKTQIVKILKQKAKILESWNSNEGAQSQKRLNVEKYGEINGLLWKWYTRARESNIPVDGPMLVEEARILAERIGDDTFKGTSGWLDKWKKRHNMGQMNIAGAEEGDVSQETIDSWNEGLEELIRG